MYSKGIASEEIEKIYKKFGHKPFKWAEVRDLNLKVNPILFKYNGMLKRVKEGNTIIYQIPEEELHTLKDTKKYRIRRKPHSTNFFTNNLINKYQIKEEVKCE